MEDEDKKKKKLEEEQQQVPQTEVPKGEKVKGTQEVPQTEVPKGEKVGAPEEVNYTEVVDQILRYYCLEWVDGVQRRIPNCWIGKYPLPKPGQKSEKEIWDGIDEEIMHRRECRNFPPKVYTNDYLNPFTLTFKNPKTVEMLNIIILYHYVMAFLVGIIIFTFIFIFLSFFRSYPYFYSKLKFEVPSDGNLTSYEKIAYTMHTKKMQHMEFYKADIKRAMKDQVTHAPVLEFVWVIFPAVILIFIAYPSIIMLYYNEAYVNPIFNISAIGNQWFWTYEYNDFNLLEIFKKHITSERSDLARELETAVMNVIDFLMTIDKTFNGFKTLHDRDVEIVKDIPLRLTVDCNLIIAKDPKFLRLLSTDQCLVLPSKTPLRLLITSNDVIHSWAVPSYGVKVDAVPGRINQQILNVPLNGTSWGQCSELCGVNHAYMPIEVKMLHFADFLFFMELKLKEILMPYFTQYYTSRIDVLRNFVKFMSESLKNGTLPIGFFNRDFLEVLTGSRRLVKYVG